MFLYLAPLNRFSNHVYRHLILKRKADFVFTELIRIQDLHRSEDKIKYFKEDLNKTIFQIGISNKQEIDIALKAFSHAKELNINMDCPMSSMKDTCGAMLRNEPLMDELTEYFAKQCKKVKILSSVKIRLGTDENNIQIEKYLDMFEKNSIDKVYIHARPLRYTYLRPALLDPLKSLKKYTFPIIISGDVDNYISAKKITEIIDCDIMIGRAAFMNPFLFEEIKDRENLTEGPYDPINKDRNIIKTPDSSYMTDKKKDFIREYRRLAEKENITINLTLLFKGLSSKDGYLI
ncbi:MAG: tRNA-dihydrouridine synthase family protein [Nanoarchaeota archaeon]|nr:tRNA-dihydrouridine synthase family protein [Nanoarchaeota archaeon]